jgi:hypothetical protein
MVKLISFSSEILTRQCIRRTIRGVNATILFECFAIWIDAQRVKNWKEYIAFDGKTVWGSGHNQHTDVVYFIRVIMVDLVLHQSTRLRKKERNPNNGVRAKDNAHQRRYIIRQKRRKKYK